jgi:hypothetical protein
MAVPASRHIQLLLSDFERNGQRLLKRHRGLSGLAGVLYLRQDDAEGLLPQLSDRVSRLQNLPEPLGDLGQELILIGAAQTVQRHRETCQVDREHGKGRLRMPAITVDDGLNPVQKQCAVGKTRDGIVDLALGNVGLGTRKTTGSSRLRPQHHSARQHPPV